MTREHPGVSKSTFGSRRRRPACGALLLSLVCLLAGAPRATASEFDVIINELHYNVLVSGGETALEFVELFNRGSTAVDLSGWRFRDGITWTFPDGTWIDAAEYLVLARDPDAARAFYGLERALGPYGGQLSNDGEIVELVDAADRVISRVRYDDDSPWPSRADGHGPSMELTRPDWRNDLPQLWKSSSQLHGTPGRANSRLERPRRIVTRESLQLLAVDSLWRVFRGAEAPSEPEGAWADPEFDDQSWEELPGGFGFGDLPDEFTIATTLDDMRDAYSTLFLRGVFELDGADATALASGEATLTLETSYDDGFVAYLNGVEIERENAGAPDTPVPYNTIASSSQTDTLTTDIDPTRTIQAVRQGVNVLGIVGLNRRRNNGDFYIGARLTLTRQTVEPAERRQSPYIGRIINEVLPFSPDGPPSFVELYNPTATRLDLGDHRIVTSRNRSFRVPAGTSLAPGEFALLSRATIGFDIDPRDTTYVLLRPDEDTILDHLEVQPRGEANSYGRYPGKDDDEFVFPTPTPGEPNLHDAPELVVIQEIQFHPEYVPPDDDCARRCSDLFQWIELHNLTNAPLDLGGWSLSGGVDFELPPATTIPARGQLVVAADPESFLSRYPNVTSVVGGWTGRLSHASDTIHLNDALGNRVDRVVYGDGKPVNDEDPEDGVDDGTFRGSNWPLDADGSGRSIELQNPLLDNRDGLAWSASVEVGGTPGAVNSVHSDHPGAVVGRVRHRPLAPFPGEPVVVSCRISSVDSLARAEVLWSPDGSDMEESVPLLDNGEADDGLPGDGIFGATIPPQADDGAVVRFRILVEDDQGQQVVTPLAPRTPPYSGFQGPFYLYEVSSQPIPDTGSPVLRIVMTAADREELEDRSLFSDVMLPATVIIADDEAFHVVGLRYRGENSRREDNKSFRIEFPSERLFADSIEDLNINAPNGGAHGIQTTRELLATDLIRRAGTVYIRTWPLTLRFPGEVDRAFDPRYIYKENLNEEFLDRMFGNADHGNLYRARNPRGPGNPNGNLSFLGEDPEPYRPLYQKKSEEDADDFSDIIELCRVMDVGTTSDEEFADAVEPLIDAAQWAQFFALQDCLTNTDGGIWNNNGEDYALYRIPADSTHPAAGRWWLIAWDLEETFSSTGQRLFRVSVPTVRRFLTHDRFAPLYYRALHELAQGPFSRQEMRKSLVPVRTMFSESALEDVVDDIESTVAGRLAYFDDNILDRLTVGVGAPETPGPTDVLSLVAPGDSWRFFRGLEPPAGETPTSWTLPGYDDSSWEEGPTGIGYGDGDDATVLDDMEDSYTTVFARTLFAVDDLDAIGELLLIMDYDDAYVAYLNGVEVARSPNAPGGDIAFDSEATSSHESSQGNPAELDVVDLDAFRDLLVVGQNTLAVVGLNNGAGSSDFTLLPVLGYREPATVSSFAAGCGDRLFTTGGAFEVGGLADAAHTRSVLVDGQLATLSYITSGDGPYGAVWGTQLDSATIGDTLAVVASESTDGLGPPLQQLEVAVHALGAEPTELSSAELAADTTLTAEGGPYLLSTDIDVPAGSTLRIDEGVTLLADTGVTLRVEGHLVVDGTPGAPVCFVPTSCEDPWSGIEIVDTGTEAAAPVHRLAGLRLEGDLSGGAALRVRASRVTIADSLFATPSAAAIELENASIEIARTEFAGVREGIRATSSSLRLIDCRFEGTTGSRDALFLSGDGASRSLVEGCSFFSLSEDAVVARQASVDVLACDFVDVAGSALSVAGAGALGDSTVSESLFFDCGTAIELRNAARLEGQHVTVTGCRRSLAIAGGDPGADAALHSAIVWRNDSDVELGDGAQLAVDHSIVGEGEPLPGEGNLATDPRFRDPAGLDFGLAGDSPAIGAGRGGSDMGAFGNTGPTPLEFLRGDVDPNGVLELTDVIANLSVQFLGHAAPPCSDRLDSDDDGEIAITDAIYTLGYLFLGEAPPPPPFPFPGIDPTEDDLPCER